MAGLTCSVNTCANHNSGYCCRNNIKVEGPSAVMKDQTFCSSFQERMEGAVNSTCGSTPNPHMEIRCSASRCAYNQNGHCSADHVTVSGSLPMPTTTSNNPYMPHLLTIQNPSAIGN